MQTLPNTSAWIAWMRRAAIGLLALGVLYCWFWIVTIAKAFGGHPSIFGRLAAGLVGLVLLVILGAWHARHASSWERRPAWLVILPLAWSTLGVATWYGLASPFSRSLPLALFFAATSLWLLWAWLMFFVRWPWIARLALMAGLLVVVGGFGYALDVDGIDGAALPKLVWRGSVLAPAGGPASPAVLVPLDVKDDRADRADYPRFRGADGLATLDEVRLARDWQSRPPVLRWQREVGAGWGALAVAGGRVFTQEQRGQDECVVCYHRTTGGQLWVHRDRAYYQSPTTGGGPRATPAVDGQSIYALGATGILNALDAASGAPQWTVNILTDNRATAPGHGMTGSPLVVGDTVVVAAGGRQDASLVAYDRATGKRAWHAGNDPAGYTSPLLTELAGVPQILIVNTRSLTAHDARSGAILWSFPWGNPQDTNCSQPCPIGTNRVFASTNYGTGCTLLGLALGASGTWSVDPLWSSRAMQTKFSSAVVHDGHAYGLDDGILECVSLADGQRRWKRGRYGYGQLLLAGDLIVISAEDGRVALVEATSAAYRELGQFQAIEGKTWNHPALAGGQLFVRNNRQAACWELPLATE